MARRRRSPQNDSGIPLPLGVSPDGSPLNSVEELPELPLPKKVIVGGDGFGYCDRIGATQKLPEHFRQM